MKARKSDDKPRNVLFKKKAIRDMREGVTGMDNGDGTTSTHRMAWEGPTDRRRGEFMVFPTIAPKAGKESSTSPLDWVEQGPEEAISKGEEIRVKSRRKAESLAAGSWKRGKYKK